MHLQGEWSSTFVAARPGEYDVQLQVSNIIVSGNPARNASASSLEELRSRLSRPFWATYRSDGGLLAIYFFHDVSPSDCNLLQMVATELQLVRPESARPSWTSQERDGAGEYAALYAMSGPDRVIKRKLKYVHTDGAAGLSSDMLRVSIDDSTVTFSVSSDNSVLTADGSNRTHLDFSLDHAQQLAAVTEIHLSNRRTLRAPDLTDSLLRALPNVTSSPIITHQTDPAALRAQADGHLLEGFNTESLLAAAFGKGDGDAVLADRLGALFRQRPEAAVAAAAVLKKNGPERRVTNALALAGSAQAVATLALLARDTSLPEKLRVDSVLAFLEIQHPDVEAMRVTAGLVRDSNPAVRAAARLMSGAMARAGRRSHAAEAQAIDESLIALYHDSHDAEEASELLRALGNSAGPSVVPVIKGALVDARESSRVAAVCALRLAPGSEIDDLLAQLIVSDNDPVVRSEAIFAARFRQPLPPAIADALLRAASTDGSDYVRSDAVALLRQNSTASPEIVDALARVAEHDSNPGIRRQASRALPSVPTPPL